MTIKTKFYLVCIFFGGLGLSGLYIGIDIFITGTGPRGQDILLNHYSNPILKYAIAFLAIGLSVPCLAFPFLAYKGALTLDYYNSPKHIKAKNNFIMATLLLPASILMFLVFYNEGCGSGLHCNKAILLALLYVGFYLHSIIILIKNKDKFFHNNSVERDRA